jgi:DNA helicase II / ATP-dependent DNA helicase PcrA
VDEELRLLYVALTRARNELFVSYPVLQRGRSGGDYFASLSRFVADIPETLLEPMQLVHEPATIEEAPRALPTSANDQMPF